MKKSKLLMPLAGIAAVGSVAPIAIMATSCSGVSASESDKAFLTKINDLMKYGREYCTPHNAISALKNNNIDVLAYKLSNTKLEFAFDANAKKFIIMNGDSIVASPDDYKMENVKVVFKFTNKYDKNSKYGQYLLDEYDWTDSTAEFEFTGSIDVGNNTNIKNMKYVGTTSNDSQTVLVRTYCEYLNFAENNDTIYHTGESNNIEVSGSSSTTKCNYMELGRTAYLYVNNTELQVARINTVETAQIDVLEAEEDAKSVVTIGNIFNESCITIETGKKITGFKKHIAMSKVGTVGELVTALTATTDAFIRLTASFDIPAEYATALEIKNRSFVLDLAGNSITDKSTFTTGGNLIQISADSKESSCIFMDSQKNGKNGKLTLKNHSISVIGTDTYPCTLYLEGANITYTNESGRKSAIMVGDDVAGSTRSTQPSKVYMYGGTISAKTTTTPTLDIQANGIELANNAYVQVIYGSIYASCAGVRGGGQYPNTYMELIHTNIETLADSTYSSCIFMPNGKLNIIGGTYKGHCCLGIKGGTTTISGGYFHATGSTKDLSTQTSGSNIEVDGSVINVNLVKNASTTAYGTDTSVTIHNATLQSENSYILQIKNDTVQYEKTTPIAQKFEIDFYDGVYYYGKEVTNPTYNGIRIDSEVEIATTPYLIHQNAGQWIKTK